MTWEISLDEAGACELGASAATIAASLSRRRGSDEHDAAVVESLGALVTELASCLNGMLTRLVARTYA